MMPRAAAWSAANRYSSIEARSSARKRSSPTSAIPCSAVMFSSCAPSSAFVDGVNSGSGWKDYQRTGAVCGQQLPEGLEEAQKLPEPTR